MIPRSPLLCLCLIVSAATAADPPVKKITPGQAIVPDRMRRLFGELVSLDLKTRTGTFRNEVNDEIMPFTVLPYAELLHHATNGDLQDFRVGERALFRLHEDEKGKWVWLTYIQDEMNFLKNHGSYYWVDAVDPATGQINFTRSNAKKTEMGEKGVMETDAATRFWKDGKPAAFKDIAVGDKLRAKTHGTGKGKTRVCWEVFLDDASLEKFQTDQQAVHLKRLEAEGLAGYVDSRDGKVVRLTLFQERVLGVEGSESRSEGAAGPRRRRPEADCRPGVGKGDFHQAPCASSSRSW